MIKSRNSTKIINIIVLLQILFLSVGFSALQSLLNAENITSIVRIQKDIRVTNLSVSNSTSNATSHNEDYNIESIMGIVTLPTSTSTITYRVEVTNIGNVVEGIYSIEEIYKIYNDSIGLNENNLEIKNMTINLKEALCDDQNSSLCSLGSVSTFDITIGYKDNGYDGVNLNHYIELNFDFRQAYTITYQGITNVSNLPTTIMEGDSLNITFVNEIPSQVNVENATYSYNSPTLTLSNPTNNVIISSLINVTYNNITTQNLPSQIVKGNDLIVTFTDNDIVSLNITMNSLTLTSSDYTYTNNVLTIPNTTGNIVITANKQQPSSVIVFDETTEGTEEHSSDLDLSVSDYINQTFEYVNNSGRTITSIRLEIVYSKKNSGNTSGQYLVGRLSYNGNSYLSNQVEIPKQSATNQTLLIGEFNNISIPSSTNITFSIDLANSNFSSTNITIISQNVIATYSD